MNVEDLIKWLDNKAQVPKTRLGFVVRQPSDCRSVARDIIALYPQHCKNKPVYIPAYRKIEWANGSYSLTFSVSEVSHLCGPEFHYFAVFLLQDEMSDPRWSLFYNCLKMATRLGENPEVRYVD